MAGAGESKLSTRMIRVTQVVLALACLAMLAAYWGKRNLARSAPRKPFAPPAESERVEAVGSLEALSPQLQRAFDPADDFAPIPSPKAFDWLAEHPESGQAFDQYRRQRFNRPDAKRRVIHLLPLGDFPRESERLVEQVGEIAADFFMLEVKVLPQLDLDRQGLTTRINKHGGQRQVLSTDVLDLLRKKLPKDSYCIQAVTLEDLYPEESWNFVFGQASLVERVGVYSFARYDPAFYGKPRGADYQQLILLRGAKVLVHEAGHMFGLYHCIYYSCVMNGSNHLRELDKQPIHLCPVCLRKLHYNIGFDIAKRYSRLQRTYEKHGLKEQAQWMARRLSHIKGQ